MGSSGPIYECYLEGKLIHVDWNIDHAFYRIMIVENQNNKDVLTTTDYLAFAMASAELLQTNDATYELLQSMRAVVSTNLAILLGQ